MARKLAPLLGGVSKRQLAATAAGVSVIGLAVVMPASLATRANAKPPAAAAFCSVYPDSETCSTGIADCATCHTVAPARNLFGRQLADALAPGQARPLSDEVFMAALPDTLRRIEGLDADGDGFSNLVEISGGTRMADASSAPMRLVCDDAERSSAASQRWNTCGYDPAYAYRKIHLDFCGRSPTRAEAESFARLEGDEAAWRGAIGEALESCLDSPYWAGTNGALWNLANTKIEPVDSIKSGDRPGPIPLADYEYDYNLFTYVNTDDRDVRDLLLAQYFVARTSDAPPAFEFMTQQDLRRRGLTGGQSVTEEKRVGMLTTRWFLNTNTMFTAVPRTSAAQAYRAYLGFDIAKMEGLGEFDHTVEDYDNKGVDHPDCAVCHETLDPLAYPFTRYNGIIRANYAPDRLEDFTRSDGERVIETPEAGILLGQPVADLREWGEVAANSEPFAQTVARDYWELLIGRAPQPQDQVEYNQMWRGLMSPQGYNYRVEKMLAALVFTNAYGRP